MTHKPFDLEKAMRNGGKCRTALGQDVRLLCTDAPGKFPVIGYRLVNGTAITEKWTLKGDQQFGGCNDLINIPEKRTGWIAHEGPGLHSKSIRWSSNIFATKEGLLEDLDAYDPKKIIIQEISWEE